MLTSNVVYIVVVHARRVCSAFDDLRVPELAVPPTAVNEAPHRDRQRGLQYFQAQYGAWIRTLRITQCGRRKVRLRIPDSQMHRRCQVSMHSAGMLTP